MSIQLHIRYNLRPLEDITDDDSLTLITCVFGENRKLSVYSSVGWLVTQNDYERGTVMVKSKSRDFSS